MQGTENEAPMKRKPVDALHQTSSKKQTLLSKYPELQQLHESWAEEIQTLKEKVGTLESTVENLKSRLEIQTQQGSSAGDGIIPGIVVSNTTEDSSAGENIDDGDEEQQAAQLEMEKLMARKAKAQNRKRNDVVQGVGNYTAVVVNRQRRRNWPWPHN